MIWDIKVYGDKTYRIKQKETETEKECISRVKEHMDKFRENNILVEAISRTRAYPPNKNTVVKRGQLYCPYCRKYRVFIRDESIKFCSICNISDQDFYVRTHNKLWWKEAMINGNKT